MQYTYRELQSMLRDAREAGFECVYPLNSKRSNLEEMYEDYCAWRTTNQYKQEQKESYSKEDDNYKSCDDSTVEPTWEEIVDFAVNTSHMKVYQWSYHHIQCWLRTLRDRHSFALRVKLNSSQPTLTRELKHWLNHIKESSEAGRKRSEERQSWWNEYYRNKERWQNQHQDNQRRERRCNEEEQRYSYRVQNEEPKNSFLICGIDIFKIDLKSIGWTIPAQTIFGCTKPEIKQAWRKLANEHHPDHGGDKEVFQQLNNIHSRLYELYR